MKTCPNCKKELRDNFEFCYVCGSMLDGGIAGDYSTDVRNVFQYDGGFIYLFTKNGSQIVIKDKSIESLKEKVMKRTFPWVLKNGNQELREVKSEVKRSAPKFENEFIKASALAETKIVKTSSNFKKDDRPRLKNHSDINIDEKKINRIDQFRSVSAPPACEVEDLPKTFPREFGIEGVSKVRVGADYKWVFKRENKVAISDEYLDRLKEKVLDRGYVWNVCDVNLADRLISDDIEKRSKRQEHILNQRSDNVIEEIKEKSVLLNKINEQNTYKNPYNMDLMFK